MSTSAAQISEFIRANDVKFIRLAFCNLFGIQKNISVNAAHFERSISRGIPFDASSVQGFSSLGSDDAVLCPDLDTLTVLPGRPTQGRVARFLCDLLSSDGTTFFLDTRHLLKDAVAAAKKMDLEIQLGPECEFYLFKTDDDGEPTHLPHDFGTYFDIAPLDRGENVRREICLTLEEMGLFPETSHHESGPGQNEIDFQYHSALRAADDFLTFKSVVKAIASLNGLYASFMPRPLADQSGNGLHINVSLFQGGRNLMDGFATGQNSAAEQFVAGVLSHVAEMSAFLNPTVNSYDRLGLAQAPGTISWSFKNRSNLIRIPAETGERARFELRSPDPSVNPYLAFALVIRAGLDGIARGLSLPDPTVSSGELPTSLSDALTLAENSRFIMETLGQPLCAHYIAKKRDEAAAFVSCGDKADFYEKKYFRIL